MLPKTIQVGCRLAELLDGNMPGFSLAATRYDEDARKAGCARRVVGISKHAGSAFTKKMWSCMSLCASCSTTHMVLCCCCWFLHLALFCSAAFALLRDSSILPEVTQSLCEIVGLGAEGHFLLDS